MGNDTALAVLSDRRPPLFNYFKQLFAQVTNPAIDPIRESIVMSLQACVGPEINLLDETRRPLPPARDAPADPAQQRAREAAPGGPPRVRGAHGGHHLARGARARRGWSARLEEVCQEASEWVNEGVTILILSDRNLGAERAAIPSLLATAAVHHHLVRQGTRLRCGLVVETGEAREVHHIACLIGYGAAAVNPYIMFESLSALEREGRLHRGPRPGRGGRTRSSRRSERAS